MPPMGRLNVDLVLGFRFDPTAKDAAARKSERVHAIIIDHCQFKVTVKLRSVYPLAKVCAPANPEL